MLFQRRCVQRRARFLGQLSERHNQIDARSARRPRVYGDGRLRHAGQSRLERCCRASGCWSSSWSTTPGCGSGSYGSGTTGCAVTGLKAQHHVLFQCGRLQHRRHDVGRLPERNHQRGRSERRSSTAATAYFQVSGSLFSGSGPSYLDVHQGSVGDCWLMAGLAEVATRCPADIQGMFTADGTAVENGVTVTLYKVRLYSSAGTAGYFVVDTELPSGGGYYDQCPVECCGWPWPKRPMTGQWSGLGHHQLRQKRFL